MRRINNKSCIIERRIGFALDDAARVGLEPWGSVVDQDFCIEHLQSQGFSDQDQVGQGGGPEIQGKQDLERKVYYVLDHVCVGGFCAQADCERRVWAARELQPVDFFANACGDED